MSSFAIYSSAANLIEDWDTLSEAEAALAEWLSEYESLDVALLEFDDAGLCVRRHWPDPGQL